MIKLSARPFSQFHKPKLREKKKKSRPMTSTVCLDLSPKSVDVVNRLSFLTLNPAACGKCGPWSNQPCSVEP